MGQKITKSKEVWRKELAPEKFHILIEKGTEPPFTGKFNKHDKEGIYVCSACGQELFRSDDKYDSGSGWPSFWTPISNDKVELVPDNSLGIHRTEVVSGGCGGAPGACVQ